MSGKIEIWLNDWAQNWIPKIPGLSILTDHSERQLAGQHVTLMAAYTLGFDCLALAFYKWIAIGALATFYLIYDAEKPPVGRKIDWITRIAGWAIGAVPAIFILIFG